MADQGSMDDLLSKEIDQTQVSALVGSLESQLASAVSKECHRTVSSSSFNNNHVNGVNASVVNSPNILTVSARPQQTVVNMQNMIHPNMIAINKAHPNNSVLINSSVKGNISNPQIIGISSIINANTHNITNSVNNNISLANHSVTQPFISKQINSNMSPSIRIVMNNTKSPYNISPNLVPVSSAQNTATSKELTSQSVFNEINGSVTAVKNLAPISADKMSLPVFSNGSNHLQGVQHKEGSGVPHVIVKSDTNHVIVNSVTKSDLSVIQGFQQGMRQAASVIPSGSQTILKPAGDSGPSIVNIRPQMPITHQQHMLVRTPVATTLAYLSPSVQGINASSNAPIRPALLPPTRPGQVRVTNQLRVQHPNLAPRQQVPQTQGTLTIPHGALLMRNESGQIVLVSAPQTTVLQQAPVSSSVVKTLTSSNNQVQNPLTTQAPTHSSGIGLTRVSVQPQGASVQQQQPVQVRGLQQLSDSTTPTMSIQPAIPISQTAQAVNKGPATVSIEMNKAMIENVKKCKNFLSTLIKLARSQPEETVKNVKTLIQGLIDDKVEPEVFTEHLQHELQSSPQPYLVPFLKKSLPLLRQSMIRGHMTVDGIKPPPSEVISQAQSIAQPLIPTPVIVTQQIMAATGNLTTQSAVTLRPPVQSLQFRSSPGPVSSKLTSVRQHVPQVAIAHGVNKVGIQGIPQQLPSQQSQLTQNQSSVKIPARPTPPAARTIRPVISAASVREKRKFESLKDGDDDINDVATMGGVNLSEESKNILATTNADFIGAQTRSCKDEIFLSASPLLKKISVLAKNYGIEDVSPAVVNLISHATEERLRDMVTKLSTITEHRIEIYKMDARYEVESETKLKLKFVEELDKLERKRHEEQEREKLLRAIKSRSKNEDPEQLKLKQKAKELQLAEAEELRQKEANQTALAAIGPRKKRKLDFTNSSKTGLGSSGGCLDSSASSSMTSIMRPPRVKRVNIRDVQFLLECERATRKSELLYKTFLK